LLVQSVAATTLKKTRLALMTFCGQHIVVFCYMIIIQEFVVMSRGEE
jgi:hypothetical protein